MAYTDLSLYDTDVVRLVQRAVSDITSKFPEWAPLEGSMEMVLLEAFSMMVAETVYAANRVPGIVMEDILGLYGLVRDAGEFPQVDATFTVSDNGQVRPIPAGTRILVRSQLGTSMVFATNAEVQLAGGVTTATVLCVGDTRTSAYNGVTGLTAELLDSVAYVEKVQLAGTVTIGRDEETLQSYLDRGAALMSRLTSTLVRADQFATAAMEDTNVVRAISVDLYDPTQNPPTGHAGHVTVAVLGQNGAVLTPTQKTALETRLEGQAVAMLDVHVVDASVTQVDVTVDVVPVEGWLDDDVKTSVTNTLDKYLDPASWSFGGTVYYNELISIIDHAPGVQRVISLTAPSGDLVLTGVGPVADLGTATVTVNGA